MKQPTSFRLSDKCRKRLEKMARYHERTQTSVIEDVFREIEALNEIGAVKRGSFFYVPTLKSRR